MASQSDKVGQGGATPGRVTLKLKTSQSFLGNSSITATPTALSPPVATPGGSKKIVLKRTAPPTPSSEAPPFTTKLQTPAAVSHMIPKRRISKPTAKKRTKVEANDDEAGAGDSQPALKRPKLILKKSISAPKPTRNPSIVLKQAHKGELPTHPKGEGYD